MTNSSIPMLPSQTMTLSSYALGLVFIFLVSLIWSAASIMVQFLYTNESFDSPFLLTYIGASLFVILLPMEYAKTCLQRRRLSAGGDDSSRQQYEVVAIRSNGSDMNEAQGAMVEFSTKPLAMGQSGVGICEGIADGDTDDEVPKLGAPLHHDDLVSRPASTISLSHDNLMDHERRSPSMQIEDSPSVNSHHSSYQSSTPEGPSDDELSWTIRDHCIAAIKIAPIWFISNWAYNASLKFTSITSSTVLASTGSLFTFAFAVLSGDERYTYIKLFGVIFGMMGSIITGLHDASEMTASGGDSIGDNSTAWMQNITSGALFAEEDDDATTPDALASVRGDVLGLMSAVGYGSYTVMIRVLLPKDESKFRMPLFLGFVGLCNFVTLLPICIYQLFFVPNGDNQLGILSELSWMIFACVIVKGLFDNVLSDYLWARAVVLTDATVATVGLGLTIPLAFISDWLFESRADVLQLTSILGAVSVLVGFVLVNLAATSGEQSASERRLSLEATQEDETGAGTDEDGDAHAAEFQDEIPTYHDERR